MLVMRGLTSFLFCKHDWWPVHCTQTYTNAETHRIVLANEHLLPTYDSFPPNVNNIDTPKPAGEKDSDGIGPRYCPSLYLKVKRFAGRDRHVVWLEPEGLPGRSNLVYPVGKPISKTKTKTRCFVYIIL
jgi:tRNA uridine 5-carboxymethylaminomethyl modification enzyme